MLELKNITKIYNPGEITEACLFRDFNLSVEAGEFVSIVGSRCQMLLGGGFSA